MGGGLMQLVAYGAQDIYLTGNPQITFFKVVYRRHTNFACEAIEQTFTGSVDFGRKISATIERNGDLVGKMYLEVNVDVGHAANGNTKGLADHNDIGNGAASTKYCRRLGHALVREVQVEIGGQCIDTHYGEWLELWSQLTLSAENLGGLRTLIDGNIRDTSQELVDAQGAQLGATKGNKRKLYVPLQFWFNRNPGLALPLIALQYHEVKINVFLEDRHNVGFSTAGSLDDICLYCDFMFLDTDERRRFAQVSHEYLIEQLQYNNIFAVPAAEACGNVELRFNHPCKEIVWTAQPQILGVTVGDSNKPRLHPFEYSRQSSGTNTMTTSMLSEHGHGLDSVVKAKLQLNGHDRFREREGSYFRCVQPYQHHTGGHLQGPDNGFYYVYSFALKPEEHQPSGTCNFSRIDNANLQLTLGVVQGGGADRFVKVWATNYNVLRVMSGMGGLAYSN